MTYNSLQDLKKKLNLGIVINNKQVVNHSPPSILNVFTQVYNCIWVGVHTYTNETHSLTLLQDLIPTLTARCFTLNAGC